jgi:hypothetical protein
MVSPLPANRGGECADILPRKVDIKRWYKKFVRHRRHKLQKPSHTVSELAVSITWTLTLDTSRCNVPEYPNYRECRRTLVPSIPV